MSGTARGFDLAPRPKVNCVENTWFWPCSTSKTCCGTSSDIYIIPNQNIPDRDRPLIHAHADYVITDCVQLIKDFCCSLSYSILLIKKETKYIYIIKYSII